jgi:hypothetical protein
MTDVVDDRSAVAAIVESTTISQRHPAHQAAQGSRFLQVLRTTNPTLIGRMYLVTSSPSS